MIKIKFEGLMCFHSTTGAANTRDEVVIVDDYPDHVRWVNIDGEDEGYNFASLLFGVNSAANTDKTFRGLVTHLSKVSSKDSIFDPNGGIPVKLPGGDLSVLKLAAHAGQFTLPKSGQIVKHYMAYNSILEYGGNTLDITINGTDKYTIKKEATISNLSGQMNTTKSNDPCYNHFTRYGKLLASKDCADVASVSDLGVVTLVAEAVETERGTIVIMTALQTQCSNTNWP